MKLQQSLAFRKTWRIIRLSMLTACLVTSYGLTGPTALAASANFSPTAKISFTFDDGPTNVITQAVPALASYGLNGTAYIITGCVGMNYKPNTCRANPDATYLTWDQVVRLQNTYGWEVGSHTVNHYCLASFGNGCQPNKLTVGQIDYELSQSKADLAAHGISAVDFASPYGDYDNQVLAEIAKYYQTQRGFADIGLNGWPYSDYYLMTYDVQGKVSVSQVEHQIDLAIAQQKWLILVFHNIKIKASKNDSNYEWSTANLKSVAAYVQSKQAAGLIKNTAIDQGLVKSNTNLLANSSFNDGIADGWTTDSPANVLADALNNGSMPSSLYSIKFVASDHDVHLFSPKVAVDSTQTYVLKNFINVDRQGLSGELAFYIDEYDMRGNWISGQYKVGEPNSFVESLNFSYQPTSSNVTQAALQVFATGNSEISAYLDNTQWFIAN